MSAIRSDGYARRRLRTYWADVIRGTGSYPCGKCGKPITIDMKWHVGHITSLFDGGETTVQNTQPEHEHCNTSEGGKIRARMTNMKKYPNNYREGLVVSYDL